MKHPVLVHAGQRTRPFLLLAALLSVTAALLLRWTKGAGLQLVYGGAAVEAGR